MTIYRHYTRRTAKSWCTYKPCNLAVTDRRSKLVRAMAGRMTRYSRAVMDIIVLIIRKSACTIENEKITRVDDVIVCRSRRLFSYRVRGDCVGNNMLAFLLFLFCFRFYDQRPSVVRNAHRN